MADKILIRRCTEASRLTETPALGELLYAIDSDALYVGDGATVGGNPVDKSSTHVLLEGEGFADTPVLIDAWDYTKYRSAKYVINVEDYVNDKVYFAEFAVIHDGANAFWNLYGIVESDKKAIELNLSVTLDTGLCKVYVTPNVDYAVKARRTLLDLQYNIVGP